MIEKPPDQIISQALDREQRVRIELEKLVKRASQAPPGGKSQRESNGLTTEQLTAVLTPAAEAIAVAYEKAEIDELTGFFKKDAFAREYDHAIEQLPDNKLSLFVSLDIDNFKGINDTFGHPTGDAVIRQIAAAIQNAIRPGDFAGRFGGDELALCLSNIPETGEKESRDPVKILDRITKAIQDVAIVINEKRVPISVSMGCTVIHHDNKLYFQEALARSDKALYVSKIDKGSMTMIYEDPKTSESFFAKYKFTDATDQLTGKPLSFYLPVFGPEGNGRETDLTESYEHCLHEVRRNLSRIFEEMDIPSRANLTLEQIATMLYQTRTAKKEKEHGK